MSESMTTRETVTITLSLCVVLAFLLFVAFESGRAQERDQICRVVKVADAPVFTQLRAAGYCE